MATQNMILFTKVYIIYWYNTAKSMCTLPYMKLWFKLKCYSYCMRCQQYAGTLVIENKNCVLRKWKLRKYHSVHIHKTRMKNY